jgi:hypothetical protein
VIYLVRNADRGCGSHPDHAATRTACLPEWRERKVKGRAPAVTEGQSAQVDHVTSGLGFPPRATPFHAYGEEALTPGLRRATPDGQTTAPRTAKAEEFAVVLNIGDRLVRRLVLPDADVAPPGRSQARENVVECGVAVEQIHTPAAEDLVALGLAVHDARGGGQLLQEVPEVEQFVHCRARRGVVQRRPQQMAHLRGAIGEQHDPQVGPLLADRDRVGEEPVTEVDRIDAGDGALADRVERRTVSSWNVTVAH